MKRKTVQLFAILLSFCLIAASGGAFFAPAADAADYSAGGERPRAGDLDGDGDVTPADARIVLRVSVRLDSLDEALTKAADVDGDGEITPADARTVLRASVKLETLPEEPDFSAVKVGLICVNNENSAYDLNFINAFNETCDSLGIPAENRVVRTGVPEAPACYDAAAELAEAGCAVIFGDSFGYEEYLIEAAKQYPGVQFCHATGTRAHTENLANYHNFYNADYEGRFLTGVAAGMKLNEMIAAGKIAPEEARIGFVGAFPFAQVVSAYTAFFLGARYVCPSAVMDVSYVYAWYDETLEMHTAEQLINGGCVLISQYSDANGAPTACMLKGVPNVCYLGTTNSVYLKSCLMGYAVDWAPYMTYAISAAAAGEAIAVDWTGTLVTGSVMPSIVNAEYAAPGTREKIEEVRTLLENGALRVFDTATFTVNGETLTSYLADVDDDLTYTGDTEAVSGGYFHESEYRSAPYFDVRVDGVTELNGWS